MINLQFRITGLDSFIDATEKAIVALESGNFVEAIAKKCKFRAKYVAPRKTGRLVASIDYMMKGSGEFALICDAVNEYGVPYPEILEFGLSRYIPIGTTESPRVYKSSSGKTAYLPYMRWAVWRTLQEIDNILQQEVLKYYK